MENTEKDWKLKLRYGKLETPYKHFTVIAEGIAEELEEGFKCPPGDAFMGMKTWASSYDEVADMVQVIGKQIGFNVTGKIEILTQNLKNHQKKILMVTILNLHLSKSENLDRIQKLIR